jgi:hypothetical protein
MPQQAGIDLYRSGTAEATYTIQYMKFGSRFSHVIIKNESKDYDIQFNIDIYESYAAYTGFIVKAGEQFEADICGHALCYKKLTAVATNPQFRYMITGPVTRKKFYPVGWDNVEEFTAGAVVGTASYADMTTYLYLKAERISGVNANVQCVSAEEVDFTRLKTLYVDWENLGTTGSVGRITVSSWDGYSYAGEVALFSSFDTSKSGAWARTTTAIDVSTKIGYGKVTVKAFAEVADGRVCELKIYKIWGEA